MTGSAWGRYAIAARAATIEIRSVNGKGLAVKPRLPAELSGCERAIEDRVKARLARGTVVVQVALERLAAEIEEVDAQRFAAAASHLRVLAERAGLAPPTVHDVLLVPGVLVGGAGESPADDARPGPSSEAPPELLDGLDATLDALCESREREGATTADAIREHLAELERGLDAVAARAPLVVSDHRARLIERVNEFLDGRAMKLEPQDVVRELGVFADRVDVSEEVQRLRAHIGRARAMLDEGGLCGRPLEFLFQELLRETNTIGSKSPDVEIAHTVVAMKSAVDRLKEQAANLE